VIGQGENMISSTQKWWGIIALLLAFVPCAFANSSLTMTGAGNNVMGGVYVGPYYATVNGVTNSAVICDDFADDSYIGHSWNYTANNFSTLGSALWGNQTNDYDAAAWLTLQMLSLNSNPGSATQVGYLSYAIWSLFDKSALSGLNLTQLAGVNAWLGKVPLNLLPAEFANFRLLTPQGCTGGPGSCPGQEFMEVMPEGGSATMYLLLAGLSCFGAMLVRRRRQATAFPLESGGCRDVASYVSTVCYGSQSPVSDLCQP
jgi:hypothetical protein